VTAATIESTLKAKKDYSAGKIFRIFHARFCNWFRIGEDGVKNAIIPTERNKMKGKIMTIGLRLHRKFFLMLDSL
jgi:hypothetical protein